MRGRRFRGLTSVVLGVLLALVAAVFAAPRVARAYGLVDTSREGSLTVVYRDDGVGVSGVEVELRHVASVSQTVRLTLDEDYAVYGVSLDIDDAEGWRAAAQTLAGYVERDELAADGVSVTDEDGRATFSDLEPGLYLVTSAPIVQGGTRYEQEPALVMVPQLQADDTWEYDAVVELKHEDTPLPPPVTHESVSVVKLWLSDDAASRPASVTVQLLRDGVVVDTQVLSSANGWAHTWTDLDLSYAWTVVEAAVPEGYTGTVHREGDTFIIENEGEPEEPDEPDVPIEPGEPGDPDEPDEPGQPGEPSEPGEPGEPGEPDKPDEPTGGTVPNTGVARSLAVPLAGAGALLYALGWWLGRRAERDERS